MEPNNNTIITEDGQRLTVEDGLITGTQDPGKGLAYETGNVMDEKNVSGGKEEKDASSAPPSSTEKEENE